MTRVRRFLPFAIPLLAVSAGSFFNQSFSATAQTTPAGAAIPEADTDNDGLSDYAELHKYFTDPRKANSAGSSKPDSDWERRKEFTYTITSVLKIAKPLNPADMNDDYQDARVLSEDPDSAIVEFVYYPLNTNRDGIGQNPNWRRDYAHMAQYLHPTAAENWDEKMRADVIGDLRNDGIEPDKLTDKQLVTQVSRWLMRRSHFTKAFAIWYVHYPDGKPEVFPSLRRYFDREKPGPHWTDQAMFDQEVLGRSMFYNRVHGSCTSTAVYIATVLRALQIPTRIVFCIPPLDSNDRQQREMFLSSIHHNRVRTTIRHGLHDSHGDFANHIFNEVFVGNRWVRLNYDVLGQDIVDNRFFGLLTHILTTDSLTRVPLPETWGRRYATYPNVSPKLSSINPYQLLKVADHFGAYSHIDNPEVENEELRQVTVSAMYWKDALPPNMQAADSGKPRGSDFYLSIKEYIPNFRLQLVEFYRNAGHRFVLTASGHPELRATLSGMKITDFDSSRRPYQLFGVRIDPEYRQLLAPGVDYAIRPINTNQTYVWRVKDGVTLKAPPVSR